jgi:hypothetical protein
MTGKNERPDEPRAALGSLEGCSASGEHHSIPQSPKPKQAKSDLPQAFVEKKAELLDNLDILELLSHWRLELQIRLARKQVVFLFADTDTDFAQLTDEVRDFVRVSKMLKWAQRPRP